MRRLYVISSNIAEVGWDATTETLEVQFHSGAVYQYADVPFAVFKAFVAAESVGKYFHKHVRDSYRTTKVSG
ncbi:MAG: KTSC domain-containing protein [Patescibacteria group bacterium]|nr:KTSC domain-containing protein [Patescibacteria group bacterium]